MTRDQSDEKEPPSQVTELLNAWQEGRPGAVDELMPLVYQELRKLARINYHPQSGWFDEGPSKGPPPCGRGLKPPEVLLLLVFFLFLLVAVVVPNNGLV